VKGHTALAVSSKEQIMNRSPVRTAVAVLAVGLGLVACTSQAADPQRAVDLSAPRPAAEAPAARPTTAAPAPTTPSASTPSATPTTPSPATVPAARSTCAAERRWTTKPQIGSEDMSQSPLYAVRVGRHDCFDRVVFDINGPQPVGFVVKYVPVVTTDPKGDPLPVAGRAVLQVVVRAPIFGEDSQGHQPWRAAPQTGASLVAPASIAGWDSLAAVTFAGSFEGVTTVAVGVHEKTPFRAWVYSEPGYQHVVVDITH